MSAVMSDYDDYYDAAKKDGEPWIIPGEHGGSVQLTERRIGRPDRRVEIRWPEVDNRRAEGRRADDRTTAPRDPVSSILRLVAADANVSPAFASALPSAAWLQYRREEERAFPERDGPDGDE